MDFNVLPSGATESITGVLTAIVAWFLSRRKSQAELAATELLNEEKAVQIWRSMCADLKGELDELRHEFQGMQKKVYALENENHLLKRSLNDLGKQDAKRKHQ